MSMSSSCSKFLPGGHSRPSLEKPSFQNGSSVYCGGLCTMSDFSTRVWRCFLFLKLFKGIDHKTCRVYCCFAWTCARNMKRKISYQTREKEFEWNLHLFCIILLNGFHLWWAGLKHLLIFKHNIKSGLYTSCFSG